MRFFMYLLWRGFCEIGELFWVTFILAPLALLLLPIAIIGEWICETKIQYDLAKVRGQ